METVRALRIALMLYGLSLAALCGMAMVAPRVAFAALLVLFVWTVVAVIRDARRFWK